MSSKERVLSVFNGRQNGWALDIGASAVTGISMALHQHIAGDGNQTLWADEIQSQAHPRQDVWDRLNVDIRRAGFVHERLAIQPDEVRTDIFGIQWMDHNGQPSPISHPFANLTLHKIARRPKPASVQLSIAVPEQCTDYAILCDVPLPGIFELSSRLRGYGQLHEDFVDDPRLVSTLFDYALETAIAWYEDLLERMPVAPDLALVADDLGYQNSLVVSPESYRVFIKPRQRQLLRAIRRKTDAKIIFHSCGAIEPILKDFCQLDIDALHLQPNARDMHPAIVRQRIPSDMVLYGMLDLAVWLPALETEKERATKELYEYLKICQPVIVGPTDLVTLDDWQRGVDELVKIIKRVYE